MEVCRWTLGGQSSLFQTKFVNRKNIRPTKNPLSLQALISRGTHFIHGKLHLKKVM